MQIGVKVVMARHGVLLAAFLVQPQPEPAVLRINVLDAHADRRADTREGIDHDADQLTAPRRDCKCRHKHEGGLSGPAPRREAINGGRGKDAVYGV